MARLIVFGRRYRAAVAAVGAIPGSPRGATVGRAIGKLAAEPLPGAQDYRAAMPPTRTLWVRRVPGENVWVWFDFDDDTLTIVTLTKSPPHPLD